MRRILTSSMVLAFAFGAAGMGVARAQVPGAAPDPTAPAPVSTEPSPVAAVQVGGKQIDRGATLGTGKILIKAPLLINASKDLFGKPISIAPDVYYGVNDDLTIGITHTGGALVMPPIALGGQGLGVCLTGKDSGCPKVYNNVGFDALYRFINSPANQLAGHGGLYVSQISDPTLLQLRLGVYGEWQSGIFELRYDPAILIGLTKRDFNKEIIQLPVGGFVNITPEVELMLVMGIMGQLDGFSDAWLGSLSFGGSYALNDMIDLGAAFDLPNLYGKNGSADFRQLRFFANFRL